MNHLTVSVLGLIISIFSFSSNAGTFAYVPNSGSNNVSVIDTSNNTVTATVGVGTYPLGVSVSPDGTKVYVANEGGNTVSVIRTSDNTVTTTIGVGTLPTGVSVSPDGTKVYVSNSSSNNVSVIRTSDNTVTATVGVGTTPYAFGNFIATISSPLPPTPSPSPEPIPTLSEWAQFIMILMMIGTVGWYTRRMYR